MKIQNAKKKIPVKKAPKKVITKLKSSRASGINSLQTKFEFLQKPKIYISVNEKIYRSVSPDKALTIANKLKTGVGKYKVHVIYGHEQISKRKKEAVENEGKFRTAREARQAIIAFIDESLWMNKTTL